MRATENTSPLPKNRSTRLRFLPFILVLAISFLSVIGWYWLELNGTRRIRSITEVTAEQLSLRIKSYIESRIQVISYISDSVPPLTSEEEYTRVAQSLLDQYSGFQALNWIDDACVIRVIVPVQGNEPALGKNLRNHPSKSVRESIQSAYTQRSPVRTSKIDLLQGGSGFAVYLPIFRNGDQSSGFINAVFRVDNLIRSCLHEESLWPRYNISISENDGDTVFEHNVEGQSGNPAYSARASVMIVDKPWTLVISPSQAYLNELESKGSWLFALGGILFALAVFILTDMLVKRHFKLIREEERFRSLFEGSQDAIFIATDTLETTDINHALIDLFGFTREEILGKSILDHCVSPGIKGVLQEKLNKENYIHDYELTLTNKKGDELICLVSIMKRRGSVYKYDIIQGIIRNITEKRTLEQQFLQSQKMEAIGRLAGGVAHDFNNLLTAIIGNAELAISRLKSEQSNIEELSEIIETSKRAATLAKQLLAFSRKQAIRPLNVDIDEVLSNAARMLQRLLGEHILLSFVKNPQKGDRFYRSFSTGTGGS